MAENSNGPSQDEASDNAPASDTATAVAVEPASHRDLQRLALRDLVALATECATTEAQIEESFRAATAAENQEFEKAKWAIDQRFNSGQGEVKQKYAQHVAAIDAKFQTDSELVKKTDKTTRRRIQADSEPKEREVRAKYEHALWIADSVMEAAQARLNGECNAARGAAQQQLDQVAEMRTQAAELLMTYGQTLPEAVAATGPIPEPDQLEAALKEARDKVDHDLHALRSLRSPPWVVGSRPFIVVLLLCIVGAAIAALLTTNDIVRNYMQVQPKKLGIGAGAGCAVAIGLLLLLRNMAHSGIKRALDKLQASAAVAAQLGQGLIDHIEKQREARTAEAAAQRTTEAQAAKDKYNPILSQVKRARETAVQAAEKEFTAKMGQIQAKRDKERAEVDDWYKRHVAEVTQKRDSDQQAARDRNQRHLAANQKQYDTGRQTLEQRLATGLAQINTPMTQGDPNSVAPIDWNDPAWSTWKPPKQFQSEVRFGELRVDLPQIASQVPKPASQGPLKLVLPPPFSMPTTLGVPRQASLLIQSDRTLRDLAIRTLQMTMLRLLTCLPPGRVRFTIIDPVGLGQNFAGFMHLADHDEAMVGGRIWTERDQIDQRLVDLTEHMETVIQKYLRNEFETIDDYNVQAGELAEPYRFLVIADFPVSFEMEATRRLSSIASSGARCGVYTLVARDTRQGISGTVVDDLEHHSLNIVQDGDKLVWKDDVFQQFPLTLDPPPSEEVLTKILDVVGRFAKEAKRVEVPFSAIAPSQAQFWSLKTNSELAVPIGRMGAARQQWMRLGRGVAQHVLIAGKTGSGKSTLLHAIITNLAMWFSPDEVELYLVDFKKGVEFKTYASHSLPHARAIAVESDREFGVSVLERLDAELTRRAEIFRGIGVNDLPSYLKEPGAMIMPRTLLIIDEFQEFFSEDDKLAAQANQLLERLVRQGRAFGVHVLLGSQTIGGAGGLNRATLTQMAVRVALMTSDADSQIILGDGNGAARLLSRPGEAIYNDAGGTLEGNSPFQIAWLPDEQRDGYLDQVTQRAVRLFGARKEIHEPPIVFEGNALADVMQNKALNKTIETGADAALASTPLVWLGDPVAIKDPTAANFRRQNGANIMIIGQNDEVAMAVMIVGAIGIAAQQPRGSANFYIFDGSTPESTVAGGLAQVKNILPNEVKVVDFRSIPDVINELAEEVERRRTGDSVGAPSIYALIYGLQRYRMLRKPEDDFSFSASSDSDEKKKPNTGKQFADILREGPPVGVHVIAWCDTPIALDRTLDRNTMREFDNRILFQMSAADSSNLIDSPLANKLGFFRALLYSEEQGIMEKFRPYALPPKEWLEKVKSALAARGGGA